MTSLPLPSLPTGALLPGFRGFAFAQTPPASTPATPATAPAKDVKPAADADKKPDSDKKSDKPEEPKPIPPETVSVTHHDGTFGGTPVHYTATAANLLI